MSRIQDILAKAERDGTARRTQAAGGMPPPAPTPFAPQPVIAPLVDGTSALDTSQRVASPFASAVASPAVGPVPAPVAAELRPATSTGRPELVEGRTATPTLHPLLVAAIDPHSEAAERYRSTRAAISHREETMPLRTLMVTSPGAGDGKSITAANLALTMAQELQRRVVLVDADFRGSSVHALFGLEGVPGLSELLAGEATLDDVMVYLPDHRLTVIPAGRTPHFPTELLGSTAMRRVVDALRGRFDRVLFDTPAVLPLADAGTFAPMADGVLIVVRAGLTKRPALDRAIAAFGEEKVVGVVLNDTI
jgi:capsular exopolysaccharide synthesis family protein